MTKLGAYIKFIIIALIIIFLGYVFWNSFIREKDKTVKLEDTPVQIESVMPKGEMYLYSFIAEDYAQRKKTEYVMGFMPKEHTCVQKLCQKVSFIINMDSVKYTWADDSLRKKVIVDLPPIEYVASTQSSEFLSDDEDFWYAYNTDDMKKEVVKRIREKYDIDYYRKKAKANAVNAITMLLAQMGLQADFQASTITNKEE